MGGWKELMALLFGKLFDHIWKLGAAESWVSCFPRSIRPPLVFFGGSIFTVRAGLNGGIWVAWHGALTQTTRCERDIADSGADGETGSAYGPLFSFFSFHHQIWSFSGLGRQ